MRVVAWSDLHSRIDIGCLIKMVFELRAGWNDPWETCHKQVGSPVDALEEIKKRSTGYSNYRNDSRQVRKGGLVGMSVAF